LIWQEEKGILRFGKITASQKRKQKKKYNNNNNNRRLFSSFSETSEITSI